MNLNGGDKMQDRLRELRKALGLTQGKFAEALGVKQNTISQYESGRNEPIDAVISLICRTFNVNEIWLREGVGEMFQEKTVSEELAEFFGDVLNRQEDAEFKRAFLTILARMTPEEWRMVEAKARELVAEMEKAGPD